MDKHNIEKTIVKHENQADNPAACILSVLRHFGDDSELEKIKKLCDSSNVGATFGGITQALNELNYTCKIHQVSIDDLIESNKIMILHTIDKMTLQYHFTIFYYYQGDKFFIGNTESGMLEPFERKQLSEFWLSGYCLSVEKGI
jgi:ABC-type bacteriocin/lantibiotic exporter with double-glycine peptidase domain